MGVLFITIPVLSFILGWYWTKIYKFLDTLHERISKHLYDGKRTTPNEFK